MFETRFDLVVKPPREHRLDVHGIHVFGRSDRASTQGLLSR
jgi:hypothetical protein